jgi:hypothetical protein
MRSVMVALCLGVGLIGLGMAPSYGAETKQLTAQQERMKTCNSEASAKQLKGDARKTFMKECLSTKSSANAGTMKQKKTAANTAQQEKMKACNQQASAKNLTGDARKTFLSSCMKG